MVTADVREAMEESVNHVLALSASFRSATPAAICKALLTGRGDSDAAYRARVSDGNQPGSDPHVSFTFSDVVVQGTSGATPTASTSTEPSSVGPSYDANDFQGAIDVVAKIKSALSESRFDAFSALLRAYQVGAGLAPVLDELRFVLEGHQSLYEQARADLFLA